MRYTAPGGGWWPTFRLWVRGHVDAPDNQSPADVTDRSLLRRFRSGDQDAATQIYLRYAHRLRALAQVQCGKDLGQRLDADDIVQSVFRSFFRVAKEGFYDVPAGEELWKLLLVMALNKIRAQGAYHRAAKRDVRQTAGGDHLEAATPRRDDEAFAVLQMVVAESLQQLAEVTRTIVELRIEGYEVAEIAEKTGRSKRTIERNLQDYRAALTKILEAAG
jgi:RNA polymerase sigma factor (sigma-70 family)